MILAKQNIILLFDLFLLSSQTLVHYKTQNLPSCPDNFQEVSTICYLFVYYSPFPVKCPYKNILPFERYKIYIPKNLTVWVPAKRFNSFGLMQWIEPSVRYQEYIDDYIQKGSIADNNCLVYYNETFITTSCYERYVGICAYDTISNIENQLCGANCRQSDFGSSSNCFCVEFDANTTNEKAEFLAAYQNQIYHNLSSEACTIGLQKYVHNSFVWEASNKALTYEYWADEVNFNLKYGAATPSGWILTQEPLVCSIYKLSLEAISSNLTLFLNDYLYLNLYNIQYLARTNHDCPLVYCFSDGDGSLLLNRSLISCDVFSTNSTSQIITTTINYDKKKFASYWCQAFDFQTFELLESNVITLNRPNNQFVAIIEVHFDAGINVLNANFLKQWSSDLLAKFDTSNDLLSTFSYKLSSIIDINEKFGFTAVKFDVHIYKVNDNLEHLHSNYQTINKSLHQILGDISDYPSKLIRFLNSDYCLAERSYNLTWPTTLKHNNVASMEYCFKSDGTRLTRSCVAMYDCASWLPIQDICQIAEFSTITNNLTSLLKSPQTTKSSRELSYILSNFNNELNALDLYLILQYFQQLSSFSLSKVDNMFFTSFNNVLNMNESVFVDAQNIMRVSDGFLNLLDHISMNSYYFHVDINMTEDNLVFQVFPANKISGLLVKKQNDGLVVTTLKGNQSWQKLSKIKNLHTAIWISNNLSKKINSAHIAFANFIKLSLFIDDNQMVFNNAVGVLIPNLDTTATADTIWFLTTSKHSENATHETCSNWNYSSKKRGSWKKHSKSSLVGRFNFHLCQFNQPGFFALTKHQISDVTNDLEDILYADSTPDEVMGRLQDISGRYDEFVPMDIHLTGQILEKLGTTDEVDLEALTKVISNLHQVDRDVLVESQIEKGATDIILQNVDVIAQNHKHESEIEQVSDNNFMISITKLKDMNFTGVLALRTNKTLSFEILQGEIDINKLVLHDYFDSALVLSENLKSQINEKTKIIVTAFSNDALFNEKTMNTKSVGTIFGLVLPDVKEYNGAVQVYHKIEKAQGRTACAHWYFDKSSNVKGSWKKDSSGEDFFDLMSCNFWHTTHFALLLLEKDLNYKKLLYLDTITTITCSISLISISCVILTALFFRKWRNNRGNQILLNFAFVISLQIIVFFVSSSVNQDDDNFPICLVVGVVLHYSLISQFCWTLIIAILHFKRFVQVLGVPPEKVLLKACLGGWAVPLVPVIGLILIDEDSYTRGNTGLCYPSGLGLYLGVWFPVCIVVIINFALFIYIMYNVIHKKAKCYDGKMNEILLQCRLAFLLFFMLGLTWSFGFLGEFGFGEIFLYIFCTTATLQGFVIFLFFIVFNVNTRYLYVQAFKKRLIKGY